MYSHDSKALAVAMKVFHLFCFQRLQQSWP